MSLEGSGSTIEPHPHVALSAAPIVPQVSPMRAKLSQGIHESGRTRPSTRKLKTGIEPLSPRCLPSCAVETGDFCRNRCFLPHAERFAAASRFIAQEPSSRNACSKAHRDSIELRSGRGARGPAASARGRGLRRSRNAKMRRCVRRQAVRRDAWRLQNRLHRAKQLTCPGTPWHPSLPGARSSRPRRLASQVRT